MPNENLMSFVCHLPLLLLQERWEAFSDLLDDIHAELAPLMEERNTKAGASPATKED